MCIDQVLALLLSKEINFCHVLLILTFRIPFKVSCLIALCLDSLSLSDPTYLASCNTI